jgi:hypothetical protein
MKEKIAIRGLVRGSGYAVLIWGAVVVAKGLYDLIAGEPEANFYSPQPWEFVTKEQWLRYSSFETIYGLACVLCAVLLWKFAPRVPSWIEREKPDTGSLID